VILLGLREINYSSNPFSSPASGVPIINWALDQDARVTVGYAHTWDWPSNGSFPRPERTHIPQVCCTPFELPAAAARGKVHFMETDHIDGRAGHTIPSGMAFLWTKLQNAGFRIGLSGGTDLFCFGFGIGDLQTHAAIEGPLSYANFLAAMRAGRSAVVVGSAASVDVTLTEASSGNSARIGDELRIGSGSEVVVEVNISQPKSGPVTIMVNGQARQTMDVGAGSAAITARLNLTQSSWIAVRSSYVQTSAVYVVVDGAPIRSAAAACYLKRYMDHFIDLANGGAFKRGSLQGGMGAYMQARDIFFDRFQDAGGTSCN